MTNLMADKLPSTIQQLSLKLNEKGYEIRRRRRFSIEPVEIRGQSYRLRESRQAGVFPDLLDLAPSAPQE